MILLNAHKIEYSLPGRSLLQEVDLSLSQSEKVGLVGRNGAGKSTLLKILCEKLKPDAGQLTLRNGIRMRYLEQLPELTQLGPHVSQTRRALVFRNLKQLRD